jgi:hypothetical protein
MCISCGVDRLLVVHAIADEALDFPLHQDQHRAKKSFGLAQGQAKEQIDWLVYGAPSCSSPLAVGVDHVKA